MADPTAQTFRLALGQAKTLVVTLDTPEDVTGWAMRFRLRQGSKLVEKSTGSGITCTDAVNGVWEIEITKADHDATLSPVMPAMTTAPAHWSFWNVEAGEESPVAYGAANVYATAETG